MSKRDYSNNQSINVELSENYKVFTFSSNQDLLSWAGKDKDNFELSNIVFDAIAECLEKKMDKIIVATLRIDDEPPTEIDILVREENFQKIISAYVEKLLAGEHYERLSEVKSSIQKWDLEFPQ